jgi:hypothetical protein
VERDVWCELVFGVSGFDTYVLGRVRAQGQGDVAEVQVKVWCSANQNDPKLASTS